MSSRTYPFRLSLIALVAVIVTSLFLIGQARVKIDADIVASLPAGDPVLSDARDVIRHHPMQERIAIDIANDRADTTSLLAAAAFAEKRLTDSGLFKSVGLGREQQLFPELILHVTDHLPELFGAEELEHSVAPLVTSDAIRRALGEAQAQLTALDGIGQARLISRDPLALRNLVLARLASLAPSDNVELIQGQLFSRDRKHVLVIADPAVSVYDTAFFAKDHSTTLDDLARELADDATGKGAVRVTPVGAYRAALDNELTIKSDTQRAVVVSTIAIALLLFFGFPRPLIGLLALVPAFAGTMLALFVYSLLSVSISMLAIGFGGAVISFTVDYGIAYLLFLDRPRQTRGLEVTREVWSLGLLAMLTTAVSFLFPFLAGFPALSQLGLFAALGVVSTYLFVHLIYPVLFPIVPAARRRSALPLQRLSDWLGRGGWPAAMAAAVFGAVLLVWAKPVFRVDLESMDTVSADTLAAEHAMRTVWGDVLSRISLSVHASSVDDLQNRSDKLADQLEKEATSGVLTGPFVPSMVFPGAARSARNQAAWRSFWNAERIASVRKTIALACDELGFANDAFDPFLRAAEANDPRPHSPIAPTLYPLLGIGPGPNQNGWLLYSSARAGPSYDGESFYERVGRTGLAKIFDPMLFGTRLGEVILSGFLRVAVIVGVMTFLVSLLYLVHGWLTLIAMLPTAFSLVCTLGTLRLLGQPLGIPVIMVCTVVIGMGTDYALYLVRGYQRYYDENHPSLKLIRLSILLSFATTFIGFGVLALAKHSVLKAAGTALALGIGYSYLGTITLVPPLARRVLAPRGELGAHSTVTPRSKEHIARVLGRYRNLEGYPRLFARFKLACDPMFERLAGVVGTPRVILDVGTGFGVPAAFLLELFPDARVFGIEPDASRCAVASRALGERAKISIDLAPSIPQAPEKADTAMVLDIAHYLDDAGLATTLERLHAALGPHGRLVLRATVPAAGRVPRERRVEQLRLKLARQPVYYRPLAELERAVVNAGFELVLVEARGGREETWVVAEAR